MNKVGSTRRPFNSATASGPWRTKLSATLRRRGRPFNSATASGPWRTPYGRTVWLRRTGLQFGHGLGAVENVCWAHRAPRPSPTFNSATASGPWRTRKTSNSGTPKAAFNSATASGPWRTTSVSLNMDTGAGLQFGHGLGAVENALELGVPAGLVGPFNSATASGPWRTQILVVVVDRVHRPSIRPRPRGRGEHSWPGSGAGQITPLQFGHGLGAVENPARWRRRRPCRTPSIRPRPRGRGEPGHPPGRLGLRPGRPSIRPRPRGRGERGAERW